MSAKYIQPYTLSEIGEKKGKRRSIKISTLSLNIKIHSTDYIFIRDKVLLLFFFLFFSENSTTSYLRITTTVPRKLS